MQQIVHILGLVLMCQPAMDGSRLFAANEPSPSGPQAYGNVELIRDHWGVPHIFADTDAGAMYGLGQAAAEDRAFQMYFNLRMIQGRLAEVLGDPPSAASKKSPLQNDRLLRTLGFYRAAQKLAPKLDSETLALLEAYSAGVNDWIAQHPDQLHPLFKSLGVIPEAWTPADCIASWWNLSRFFASDGLRDLANDRVLTKGARGPLEGHLKFDDSASVVGREDVSADWIERLQQYQREQGKTAKPREGGPEGPKFSHSWVVGGKKSTTGQAVLVSDPQVPVFNPSVFYEFHLCGKSFNVRGVGVAGTPALLIGFNESVAWGGSALGADQADLFRLKTDASHPDQYFLDGQWRDMGVIREVIQVKGAEPVELTVRTTVFGPLVTSFANPAEGDPEVAVKRVPICETKQETIQGILQMMRASNLEQFTQGLALWQTPSINLIFGDRQGNIGYWVQAAIPARSSGDSSDGARSVDGSDSRNDWRGFVPHDLLPHTINPPRGWIATGNHRPVGSFYPISLGAGQGAQGHGLRSWRLYERLMPVESFTPRDVFDIHFDDVNPMRRDVVRAGLHLRDQFRDRLSADALAAIDRLENWFRNGAHSSMTAEGAGLAEELRLQFRQNRTQLAEKYGGGESGLVLFLAAVRGHLADGPLAVLAAEEQQLIDQTLAAAWKSAQRKYGNDPELWDERARAAISNRKRLYFEGLSGFGSLDSAHDLPTPALDCVDMSTIKSQNGQGYTQYVPLHDVDSSQSILPPGQSEHVGNPSRLANLTLWEQGELHPAPLSRAAVERIAVSRTFVVKGPIRNSP